MDRSRMQEMSIAADATVEGRMLSAVAYAAEELFRVSRWEERIDNVLARLGDAAKVSRAYLVSIAGASQRFEWVASGTEPQIHNAELPRSWVDRLSRSELIAGRVDSFPESERALFEARGIRSILVAPVICGDVCLGFLAFDDCRAARAWSEAERNAISAAARIAAAAMTGVSAARGDEEAIRESEERFRLITERISEVFFVSEPEPLRLLYCSAAYETIWQRPREELYADARRFIEGIAEEDRPRVIAALERQFAGQDTETEYRVVRPDGTVRWVRDRAYPIVRDGRVFRIVGLAEDVTAATVAAEEIRRAHDLYALVAKATNDVIWDWDPVGGTIIWNDALRTMFGYDPDAIDNRLQWWDQHIHPEDRDRVVSSVNQAIDSGATAWSDEYRFERADGRYTEVLDRGYISRTPDGQPIRMIGAMLDVTERKRAERIAAFMAEASAVLASSLDYASTLKRVSDLAVPALADRCVFYLVDDGAPTGEPLHLDNLLVVPLTVGDQPMGTLTLAMIESRRVFSDKDRLVAEDLARRAAMAIEHARLYVEAQQANRAKDEFLATLSHELRTPLTAILGWSKLLADTNLEPDMRQLALETIHNSAVAQARLVDDVLDVSRVISGKLRLQVQPVAIEDIARGSVDAVRLAAKTKNLEVVVPTTRTGIVMGDPDRLQQVVWNLLTNAIKFTPPGGRVEIGVETTSDKVRLVVSDTGQGIAADFLPYVFEPFRQAEGGSLRMGGLGLGLAIVRYIVEAHGGTVVAFSDGPGRGSRFEVELPKISAHL